jgi:hypothetical protein
MTTFYCLRFDTPTTWKGQVPVFISPRSRVARMYPQAPVSLFVASYDSQGYSGVIRPLYIILSHISTRAAQKTPFLIFVVQLLLVKNVLPNNGYCFVVCFAATA